MLRPQLSAISPFPNATSFIFEGAGITECLAETMREAIRNSNPNRRLRLYLASDATSDAFPDNSRTLFEFVENHRLTPSTIVDYFRARLVGGGKVFSGQVTPTYQSLDSADYQFQLHIGVRVLGPIIGTGYRRIDIFVIPTAELASVFDRFSTI